MKPYHPNTGTGRRQDGIALMIGLLLLIVMSLIGVSMMSSTGLETMMAGGARESNIAFQAAEAALRDAEATIETATSIDVDFDGTTPGLLSESDAEPDFSDPASWNAANSRIYSPDDYPEMLEQPRYIIKHVMDIEIPPPGEQPLSVQEYAPRVRSGPVSIFRITARGTSRDGSATTILQSNYGRAFP